MSENPKSFPDYQEAMRVRHAELLEWYMERPAGSVGLRLEHELRFLEQEMLENPPAGCATGLLMSSQQAPIPGLTLKALTLEEIDMKVLTDSEIRDIVSDPYRTPPDAYVMGINNQGSVGSCAAEAACGAYRCRRNEDGQDDVELNPYAAYSTTSGGSDRGSTLDANLAFLQQYGAPAMSVWPRSKGWRATPSDDAMQDALNHRIAEDGVVKVRNRLEFCTMVLAANCPVQFGIPGHSIFSSDLIDEKRAKYVNSWGNWGQNGRGTVSFDDVYWGYGAYAVIAIRGKD